MEPFRFTVQRVRQRLDGSKYKNGAVMLSAAKRSLLLRQNLRTGEVLRP